ncbi:MAG: helix-turn-helix transcriptional regulator [Dehalococcoidia bacterium]
MKVKLLANEEAIKIRMAIRGCTHQEVAEAAGITREYFSSVVGGRYSPSPGVARAIAEYLEIDLPTLFCAQSVFKGKENECQGKEAN